MSSFFSFVTTKKFPSKEDRAVLFSAPYTLSKGIVIISLLASVLCGLLLLLELSKRISITVPDYGGTLEEGVIGAPRFINPFLGRTETDTLLTTLLFSGLMSIDAQGVPTPLLAASYTLSSDGTSAQFTLHEKLSFSNGAPLTTNDIVFSYETMRAIGSPLQGKDFSSVSAVATDERTVTLTTTKSDILTYATLPVVSQAQWAAVPLEGFRDSTNNTKPIGSGAFTLRSVRYENTLPRVLTLKRNKHFIGAKPFIETINVHIFSNQLALKAALEDETITSTAALEPQSIDQALQEDFSITAFPLGTSVGLYGTELLSQQTISLLQTLSPLIDRKAIIDTIENGYGIPFTDTTTTTLSVDSGLDRLGYTKDEYGTLSKGGVPVTIAIALRKDEMLVQTATVLAEILGTLGIRTELKVFDQGAFLDELSRRTPSLILERTDTAISGYAPILPLYRKTLIHTARSSVTLPSDIVLDAKEEYWQSMRHWSLVTDTVWKWFTKQ